MTKCAVISDIHANMHALDLVLNDISKKGVDEIICLGDSVAKYYHPGEVIRELRNNSDVKTIIKGNTDDWVANNPNFKYAWKELGTDGIDYLKGLPLEKQKTMGRVISNLYHAAPNDFEAIFNPIEQVTIPESKKNTIIKPEEYKKMFIGDDPQVNFAGHTHMAYVGKEEDGKLVLQNPEEPTIFLPTDRGIVNVGSAGEHIYYKDVGTISQKEYISPYLTYALVEYDEKNINVPMKVQIVKVPYVDTLTKVYFDALDLQNKKIIGEQKDNNKKMRDSLIEDGVNIEEEIKRGAR